MTEEALKPGDVVMLKSGSPAMTLGIEFFDHSRGTYVQGIHVCYWFTEEGGQREQREGAFPLVALVKA